MLNHNEDSRKTLGKRAQHMTQRVQPACGSGQRYDVEAMANGGSTFCVIVRYGVSVTDDIARKIIREAPAA